MSPFIRSQLATLDFFTRNFAHVDNHTVDQLYVGHFKREQSHRDFRIYRHVLCHGKHKSRFTHSGTGGNNHQVGILPARGHFVQCMETAFQTTQPVRSCRRFLKHLIRFLNDRVDLRIILLHVLLRDFEQFSFRLLHQVVHVLGLVESFCLDVAGKGNQFACKKLLRDDTCVIFYVCGRGYLAAQLCYIKRTACIFQFTGAA